MADHPLIPFQALLWTMMGDKRLDWKGSCNAFRASGSPISVLLAKKRLDSKIEATAELLSDSTCNQFVVVLPSDGSRRGYSMMEEDDGDGPPERIYFDDNDVKMEYEARHPGTSQEFDVEDGMDACDKYPHYRMNDATSPITTTSAEHLYGIAFAGPGGVVSELKASYPVQLSARIDESRKCLNFDCFEYKPRCIDLKATGTNAPVPTHGDIKRWSDCVDLTPRSRSMWNDDGDETDSDDEELGKPVEHKEGSAFSEEDILILNFQGITGNFLSSRALRVRIPLSNVCGIRLKSGLARRGGDSDVGAVLVLEVKQHLGTNAFAARTVLSRYHNEKAFAAIDDWTPNKAASKATRYYLYGNLAEMKQTAALMAKLCPHIAVMLSNSKAETNSLRLPGSVEYADAPEFADSDCKMDSVSADKKKPSNPKYKMSTDDVHKLLFEKNLVDSLGAATSVNPCLKRAILLGHIKLDDATTKDTVVTDGSCISCSSEVKCTIGDVLFQETYAGTDYEDGGEEASLKCKSCGIGIYVTRLCQGDFDYDSGKFHNHCTQCKDFGICIGDYREAHCEHCGEHYFCGNSGFACQSCGGGKSKSMDKLEPPAPSTWNGEVENAMEVFEAQCARLTPLEAAMSKSMVLGPEAALSSGGGGVDASQLFAGMIRSMASQIEGSGDENEEGSNGRGPDDCTVM